jgi:hypothetical protein
MHEMVTEWRKPVTDAFIVAGLPAFATLDAITDIVKNEALKGFSHTFGYNPNSPVRLVADLVSPGGMRVPLLSAVPLSCTTLSIILKHHRQAHALVRLEVDNAVSGQCRVIRVAYCTSHPYSWFRVEESANICVIRKPRLGLQQARYL